MGKTKGEKRKASLSHWAQFQTVSWRADAHKDYHEHTSVVLHSKSFSQRAWHEVLTWLIPSIVGVLTATSGAFIEMCVEWYSDLRFGFCMEPMFGYMESCNDWIAWGPAKAPYGFGPKYVNWNIDDGRGYGYFILISTVIAFCSAFLTWAFAPMSRGSGIPEIKTILGGFTFPEALAGNTLVIKIIGLAMSVGAGLSCGKEGPLVHISCCWCNFIVKFFKRYKDNEAKQRELLSCACASGVAVAFGAPLGGVLFSYEEASSIFPIRVMLRAFLGAAVAAGTLAWWNPTGSGKLTMFNCPYSIPPRFVEYPVFVVMGVLGGVIGAGFVHWNIQVSKGRAPGTPFRRKCHIILEVTVISLFTAITSYHILFTRVLSNTGIRAFFHDCSFPDVQTDALRETYMLNLCTEDGHPRLEQELMLWLFVAGFLRYVQMIFTFGTGAAAGLFIPSLYVGAALGRIAGILMFDLNEKHRFLNDGDSEHFVNAIKPGMYAMLGAAGVLGGVCRVTISLVVIMFELTGGLQLIVPFMVVCMLAKWVGDQFTIGIYDYIIQIRKYPFLHEPDEVTFSTCAEDVMDENLHFVYADRPMSLGELETFLEEAKHGGYPLVKSESDHTFLGYLHTKQVVAFLEAQKKNVFVSDVTKVTFARFMKHPGQTIDASAVVDTTPLVVVEETPAAQLQQIFRNLGVKIILVRREGLLVGMITKKWFITQMEELHHAGEDYMTQSQSLGGRAGASSGSLKDALLPK
eukprot:TRINITY_DN17329_c0_g4_i1.p1 TRINITY_DN17329_c0_g4~~TRINITY_DN17329_c0_g4_i1.p1  ORF type:complete len:744 (-),score=132.27 TRINITY_DN17329_c0_g4_i1:157-2388(-)